MGCLIGLLKLPFVVFIYFPLRVIGLLITPIMWILGWTLAITWAILKIALSYAIGIPYLICKAVFTICWTLFVLFTGIGWRMFTMYRFASYAQYFAQKQRYMKERQKQMERDMYGPKGE